MGTLLLVSACGESANPDSAERSATIYGAVIEDLADDVVGSGTENEDLPIVFVEALNPDGIELEVQVEVIASLAEIYDVRFIDDIDEAVDVDLDHRPVREGSALVGLGAIVVDGTADVRGEVYSQTDQVLAFRYSLRPVGDGTWAIAGTPESVEPEGFVSPK